MAVVPDDPPAGLPVAVDGDLDALPSPTAAKTLAILDLLARHPSGVSAADASRRTGVTANLAFRILKTLVTQGYAIQHPDTKAYTLSRRLIDLAGPLVGDRSLVVCAHDSIRALRDATGETVQLVVESGGKGLVLDQVRGTHALQVSGQVGMQVPLHSCAPGKAILAWWSRERLAEWLRGRTLTGYTTTTLTTRQDLERDLAMARQRGWTVDRAEGIEGIHCVATPVLDAHGRPLAGVTIMAPASRLPEDCFAAFGERCMRAARAIEARLRA